MIRKLRFKLIAAAMISLFIVLAVIIGAVNLLNYHGITKDADQILTLLKDNNGHFPKQQDDPNIPDNTSVIQNEPKPPKNDPGLQSPELPYESRFFSVLLDGNGNVLSTDTGKIAAVDSSEAGEYAKDIWQSSKSNGFLGVYRYIRSETDKSGQTRIIFLDCSRSLNSFRNVLLISCGVSFFGLMMVLILMIILSKHIVQPFSENYEKQKRFITDAGHEIKTPITIIKADTEVLEMDTGPNEWIDDIRIQTDRLSRLTKDLIYLARMEENEQQLPMIDFPLSEVASETSSSFQSLAMTQSKDFCIEIEPMISFYGNEENIRKLITILLDNAIKYSNKNGQIQVNLSRKNRSVQLTVINTTDKVLDKTQLTHLFDRFYRMDASRNSETGGYGIGLSIAQAIVQMHKGKISAEAVNAHTIKLICVLPIRSFKSA